MISGWRSTSRAACWYSASSFSVDVNLGLPQLMSIYACDYDSKGRDEQIQIFDAATGSVLLPNDQRSVPGARRAVDDDSNLFGSQAATVDVRPREAVRQCLQERDDLALLLVREAEITAGHMIVIAISISARIDKGHSKRNHPGDRILTAPSDTRPRSNRLPRHERRRQLLDAAN